MPDGRSPAVELVLALPLVHGESPNAITFAVLGLEGEPPARPRHSTQAIWASESLSEK